MILRKRLFLLLSFLVFCGCAQKTRKEQDSLRTFFSQKDFSQASYLLDKSSIKKEKKNRLLYLMERGTLSFYQGNYKKASSIFVEANELVDRLYTKSIREKIASSVVNDTKETYYGSVFERSLLYYYQAMSYYNLFSKGSYIREVTLKDGKLDKEEVKLSDNEKKKIKQKVRSTLLAWDSFFVDVKRMKGVKTFLKDDLVSKIMAAKLHYFLGKRRDKEISLQLYKDARNILIKLGPTFKVFNNDFKKYNLELRDLYDKKIKKSELKSKNLTSSYRKTIDFLEYRILSITKEIRRNQYKRTFKKIKPSKEIKKQLSKKEKTNASFIIEVGHINQLRGKDFSLNLRSALENVKDPTSKALINGIGIPILTYFAMGPLGLGYVSHHRNVTVFSRHNAGEELVKEVGVEFELPYVEETKDHDNYKIQILKEGKVVAEKKVSLIAPLSGMAYTNSQEMIENSFTKRSLRVGVKYAVAIAAAYSTYKKVQDSSGELFAKPAAMAQFLLSSKGIKETEKADARHWSTLPSSLLTCDFKLKEGRYDVKVIEQLSQDNVATKSVKLGSIEIFKQKKSIFSYRMF